MGNKHRTGFMGTKVLLDVFKGYFRRPFFID